MFSFLDGNENKETGANFFVVWIPWKKPKVVKNVVRHLATVRFSLELFLGQNIFRKNVLTQTVLLLKKEEPCDVQFSAECLKKSLR